MRRQLHLTTHTALSALLLASFISCRPMWRSTHLAYSPAPGLLLPDLSDRSAVVFLRLEKEAGGPQDAAFFDGDDFLTLLTPNTMYVHLTEPGEHHFRSRLAGAWQNLRAELEPGRVYFARMTIPSFAGRIRLVPLSSRDDPGWSKLRAWLHDLNQVQPNQSARTWFDTHREELTVERERFPFDARTPLLPADAGFRPTELP